MTTTEYVTQCINEKKKIIFAKYGDGEIACMQNKSGNNCDGDKYSNKLGTELIKSFKKLCDESNKGENILIGEWKNSKITQYLKTIYKNKIPFVDYGLIYNVNNEFHKNNKMFNLTKEIQNSNSKKLLMTNKLNIKMNDLFKINKFIEIPQTCWFNNYDQYKNKIIDYINQNKNDHVIILLSSGLASEVLISELIEYNNVSILDIGSGYDFICRKGKHNRAAIANGTIKSNTTY
jgi:hypothetical protein